MTPAQIKSLRSSLGLTQKAFGERMGLDQRRIADLESGRRRPSGPVLILLAQLKEK